MPDSQPSMDLFAGGRHLKCISLNPNLTGIEKAVLHAIASEMDFRGNFMEERWFLLADLVRWTSFSRNAVCKSLKSLKTKGLLNARTRRESDRKTLLPTAYSLTTKIFSSVSKDEKELRVNEGVVPHRDDPSTPQRRGVVPHRDDPSTPQRRELPHYLPHRTPSLSPGGATAPKKGKGRPPWRPQPAGPRFSDLPPQALAPSPAPAAATPAPPLEPAAEPAVDPAIIDWQRRCMEKYGGI